MTVCTPFEEVKLDTRVSIKTNSAKLREVIFSPGLRKTRDPNCLLLRRNSNYMR